MKKLSKKLLLNGPMLDALRYTPPSGESCTAYPFSLPIIQRLTVVSFSTQVSFFVGENGTGKSTLLEAIACNAGFGAEGGSKNIAFKTSQESVYEGVQQLADCMTLSWRLKPCDGYFFRAESFYNVANYLDALPGNAFGSYGGKSLHDQSHGEGFFSFFKHRMGSGGFYILDEPEAALSPQRQLSLLVIMHELCTNAHTQFIIATHSPILLAYPGATIYSCDGDVIKKINYTDTTHYQITKQFLNNHELFVRNLLSE